MVKMVNKLVKIHEDLVDQKNLPGDIGLVLRGPYEYVIKLTEKLESCEMMYDVLIVGQIYKMIPAVYCKRIRK